MFTYIDPRVRKKLLAEGKIQRIDSAGEHLPASERKPRAPAPSKS